jgi:hypothetical protein
MNLLITDSCSYIVLLLSTSFKKNNTIILLDNFFNCKEIVIKKIKLIFKSKIIIIKSNVNNVILFLKSISDNTQYSDKYFKNNPNYAAKVDNEKKSRKIYFFNSVNTIYQKFRIFFVYCNKNN